MKLSDITQKYIVALDQGTTSSRAIVFDHAQNIVAVGQKEFSQIYPEPGWVEHDPMEIWATQYGVMQEALIKAGITMADVAAAAHVSLNTLERHFLSAIHASPSEFLKQRRLSKAQEWLKKGASVNDTCQACGFTDCSHFILLFKKQFGMTPLQFKKTL